MIQWLYPGKYKHVGNHKQTSPLCQDDEKIEPMNNTSENKNMVDVNQFLQQLKETYLAELPERTSEIESLILALNSSRSPNEVFEELYRKVHSLKGSGGTYGFGIITSICHHLEDLLNESNGVSTKIDDMLIDAYLKHVDLVNRVSNEATQNMISDFSAIEDDLRVLRNTSTSKHIFGMVVESSHLIIDLCIKSLADFPVKLVFVDDGLTALQRLLKEKYDFVIMAKSLRGLNGVALTSALRTSESINKDVKIITLTSAGESKYLHGAKPDYVLNKDKALIHNLVNVVDEIIQKH